MTELVHRLSRMSSDELRAVVERDAASDNAAISLELEGTLMQMVGTSVFLDSPTFGRIDEETDGEKMVRELIESMDAPDTLATILSMGGGAKAID